MMGSSARSVVALAKNFYRIVARWLSVVVVVRTGLASVRFFKSLLAVATCFRSSAMRSTVDRKTTHHRRMYEIYVSYI